MDEFDDIPAGDVRDEARSISADLARLGQTDPADRDAVVRLAKLRCIHRRLAEDVAANGAVQTLESGRELARPAVGLLLQTSREARDLEAALLLTAKARATRPPKLDDDADDPLTQILRTRADGSPRI